MVEFFRAGGPFMFLLLLTSIVGLTFIVERGLALRWNRVVPLSVEKALDDFQAGQDISILKQICLLKPSALSRQPFRFSSLVRSCALVRIVRAAPFQYLNQ